MEVPVSNVVIGKAGDRARNVYLFLMSLLALAIRLLPWRYAVLERNIIFGQPDAYYHLRRATIMIRNFPRLPGIDRYMAYPYGAEPPWPPLYDHVIALLSLLFGWGDPSDRTIMLVTTFLPPVLAALTVVPVYLLARRFGGEAAGRIAAFFAVVMPGQLSYSLIGSGDHHTAEVLLLVLYFHHLLTEVERPAGGGRWASLLRPSASGLFLGVGILVWQGTVVFATVAAAALCAWIVIGRFVRKDPGRAGDALKAFSRSTATAIVLVAAGRLLYPSETSQTTFDFGFFSWFQPAFLLLLLAAVHLLERSVRALSPSGGEKPAYRKIALALAAPAVLALASIPLFPSFWTNILMGIRFVLRKNDFLASINEFQPLFQGSLWPGAVTIRFLIDVLYTAGFFLPPAVAAREIYLALRRGTERYSTVLLLVWIVLFWLLALEQKRWANANAACMAVAIGMAFAVVLEKSTAFQHTLKDFREWRSGRNGAGAGADRPPAGLLQRVLLHSRRTVWAGSLLLFLGFLLPYYFLVQEIYVAPVRPISPDLYNSLIWLRENTPRTKDPWNPRTKPEYAVLGSWDIGHWIQYIAERPTVVNNFGYQLRGNGLEDWLSFEFAATEEDAAAVCRKRGVRYVFMTDLFYNMDTLPGLIGIDFKSEYISPSPLGHVPMPGEKYLRRAASRMFYLDGSMSPYGEALSHFRLVFESNTPTELPHQPQNTKEVKIYEFVKGARVVGKADPGGKVAIACRLVTNFGRTFDYETVALADAGGRFIAEVPYASSDNNIMVTAAGPYVAYTEKSALFFHVSGADVTEGREVAIDFKKQGLAARKHIRMGQ